MPVLLMFAVPMVAKKIGKKEVSAIGMVIALIANIALFCLVFVPGDNAHSNTLVWFYVLNAIVSFGVTAINLQIWSMIADCIDDMQIKNGIREDGTSYAVFMFFRKFGQIICAFTVNGSLLAMGYNFADQNFSAEQIRLMYILGTVIPVIMLAIIAYLLIFRYPLNKKRLEALQDEKEAFYAKQELEDKKKKNLPAFTNLKVTNYLPEEKVAKFYSGFEFEYFVNKDKRFYCVLVKKTQNGTYQSYLSKAKQQFNEDLEDGKVDITPVA